MLIVKIVSLILFMGVSAAQAQPSAYVDAKCGDKTSGLAYQECVRDIAIGELNHLREASIKVMWAASDSDTFRDDLEDMLGRDRLPEADSSITDPALLAAVVRAHYPGWLKIAHEANRQVFNLTDKDSSSKEEARQAADIIRVREDTFGQFCQTFLDDPGCKNITLGEVYPPHPKLEAPPSS